MKEEQLKITIKTVFGLEEVLAEELGEMGFKDVKILNRAVQVTGSWKDVYYLNVHLRCAISVLVEVEKFSIRNEDDLYKQAKKVQWTNYFGLEKTFAVKGIQTGIGNKKGRDYYGIYPLRGKCLNVRNSNISTITNNQEICDVIQALNLKYGVDYKDDKNYETLCYGRVIILTDSDVDGYHICGLLLNFFHKLFPSLLERELSFVTCMRTPIVRIYYSNPKNNIEFYTLEDFKRYQSKDNKKGEVKYFKGLGTNNNKEIESCFGKMQVIKSPKGKVKSKKSYRR